jgi:glycosyltransferase involved in cell wall biosynthesis
LESMASGLACISTKVGAVPDVIEDGNNGLLVDSGNTSMLTEALLRLIDDKELKNELQANARSYIEREHNLEMAVNNFRKNILIDETNSTRP